MRTYFDSIGNNIADTVTNAGTRAALRAARQLARMHWYGNDRRVMDCINVSEFRIIVEE